MDQGMHDRALGAVLGSACGDALGAGYETGPALGEGSTVEMRGGGPFNLEPGEWTDDTSMAVPLLEAVAQGERFDDPRVLGRIVAEWADWAQDAPDVGKQTKAVFARLDANTEASARAAALALHEATERTAGNGALMRTAPVVLGFLGDNTQRSLAGAARRVSDLTHYDEDSGDACVLWSIAIRRAIRRGRLDVRAGIPLLPKTRRQVWLDRIAEAESAQPADFAANNGWTVAALQAAVAAITHGDGLVDTLQRAVRGGNDTDTVAAIAGGLAGALYGAAQLPEQWTLLVHGWPGKRLDWLRALAEKAIARTPSPVLRLPTLGD